MSQPQDRKLLAKIALEKSEKALQDAVNNLDLSLFVSQNRVYYSIFYIVSALAYLDDFISLIKSHHKLMGKFNKKYIYEDKLFDSSLIKTYRALIVNREFADYNYTFEPTKESVSRDIELAKAFIHEVKPYVLDKLK